MTEAPPPLERPPVARRSPASLDAAQSHAPSVVGTTTRLAAALTTLAGLAIVAWACSQQPAEPCPTDDALIAHFRSHGRELSRVVANPQKEDLLAAADVMRAVRDPDGRTWLWMWHKDFPGPGGVTKGYVYGMPAPPAHAVVDDIDAISDPGGPEEKELYLHIEGEWYVFYRSSN